MKDTLIEIKNNLQGINSRMDESENQTATWNIKTKKTKHNQSQHQEEKEI